MFIYTKNHANIARIFSILENFCKMDISNIHENVQNEKKINKLQNLFFWKIDLSTIL